MTDWTTTRRQFLRLTGAAGALAILDAFRPSQAPAAEPPAADTRRGSKVLVRRDIMSLAPDGPEIEAFRRAVAVMKKRPASDPRSWIYQANVHLAPEQDAPMKPDWNQCQHGNYYFLPWHRMYTYWLERLLRDASGDPTFTVPYWNYANPSARALPLALRTKDWPGHDEVNPLYVVERNRDAGGLNNGAQLPPSAVETSWIPLRLTRFDTPSPRLASFGGRTREQPGHALSTMGSFETYHNLIHVLLGGTGGYMSSLPLSARDPVFLLHHANVDRLWRRWLEQGGGRASPLDNEKWLNAAFTFFDEKGERVKMSVKDALEPETQLGYRYDDDPPPVVHPQPGSVPKTREPETVAASKGDQLVDLGTGGPVTVAIDLGDQARKAMTEEKATLTLLVEGIRFVPADAEPMNYYEVYLNLPAGATPDFQDVHYVGNLVFAGLGLFGKHAHHHPVDASQAEEERYLDGMRAFDVTDVVHELHARKLLPLDKLTVTFVMGGLIPVKKETPVTTPGVRARFERVSLASS
jgi:tyrosinase